MAAPYSDPLAYFLTWGTYGAWLPGDARGSRERGGEWLGPDERRESIARRSMSEDECRLDAAQREAVEEVVRRHCEIRGWTIYAVNVRSNHAHVVLAAPNAHPKKVREELKSWGTRTLKKADRTGRKRWWTDGGDTVYVNDEAALEEIVDYVVNRQ